MKTERAERVGEAMRAELADLIQRELKDPRIGFLSVTRVAVSRDLARARVYLSVLDPAGEPDTLAGLRSASGFLRGEVARRLKLRLAPALEFVGDPSIRQSLHVQALLNEKPPAPPGDDPPHG